MKNYRRNRANVSETSVNTVRNAIRQIFESLWREKKGTKRPERQRGRFFFQIKKCVGRSIIDFSVRWPRRCVILGTTWIHRLETIVFIFFSPRSVRAIRFVRIVRKRRTQPRALQQKVNRVKVARKVWPNRFYWIFTRFYSLTGSLFFVSVSAAESEWGWFYRVLLDF